MSYKDRDKIYPVGTEVMYDPYSNEYVLNGQRAFIGIVREIPKPEQGKSMYTLEVPKNGSPGLYSTTEPVIYTKFVRPCLVMTPEDFVRYRENVRADINLRQALKGRPLQRMDEDYDQWVKNAYERSKLRESTSV